MDKDSAILAAAFAFAERAGATSASAQKLRALLPATLTDVPDNQRAALSDRAIGILVDDPEALSWVQTFVRERDTLKSFGAPVDTSVALQEVYVCPKGDYRWTRPFVTYPIPLCPQHHLTLQSV